MLHRWSAFDNPDRTFKQGRSRLPLGPCFPCACEKENLVSFILITLRIYYFVPSHLWFTDNWALCYCKRETILNIPSYPPTEPWQLLLETITGQSEFAITNSSKNTEANSVSGNSPEMGNSPICKETRCISKIFPSHRFIWLLDFPDLTPLLVVFQFELP